MRCQYVKSCTPCLSQKKFGYPPEHMACSFLSHRSSPARPQGISRSCSLGHVDIAVTSIGHTGTLWMKVIWYLRDCQSMDSQYIVIVCQWDGGWMAPECNWNVDLNMAQTLQMRVMWCGKCAYTWTCMVIPCHPWCYHHYKHVGHHRNAMEALQMICVCWPNWRHAKNRILWHFIWLQWSL